MAAEGVESDAEALLLACQIAEQRREENPCGSGSMTSSSMGPPVPAVLEQLFPTSVSESVTVGSIMRHEKWAHCPGCGAHGPMPSRGLMTVDGPFEALWGKHGCGCSWTISSLPRGSATGALVNIWMPDQLAEISSNATRWGKLPCCSKCGNSLCEVMIETLGDPNKAMAHLECQQCNAVWFGVLSLEYGAFVHFCMTGHVRHR